MSFISSAFPIASLCQPLKTLAIGGIITASLLVSGPKAKAAERVVLTYGPFTRTLSVDELREFANTQETSADIQFLANVSNQEVDIIHNVFTQEVRLSLRFLDRVLNSLPGEYLLFQTGQVLHTPSRQANIQALRAAFILSASDDDYVSLMEFLENYPVEELRLDGRRLQRDVQATRGFVEQTGERLAPQLAAAQEILEGLICSCDSAATTVSEPTVETTNP